MKNNGTCGLCGDDASQKVPRYHENCGIYADTTYRTIFRQLSTAEIKVLIPSEAMNANFSFDICNSNGALTEPCFDRYKLEFDAPPPSRVAAVGHQNRRGFKSFYVRLPFALMDRAVLRTTITTGKTSNFHKNI